MTSNLYKVGDWVYCEVSPFQPYVIRKIEELTKTPSGNVEAKVICAYRYQDIPASVMSTVEKYKKEIKPTGSESQSNTQSNESGGGGSQASTAAPTTTTTTESYYDDAEVADLNEQQRYNLRHRELFFSKVTDTIAATTIRAKCSVLLFNEEVEKYSEYLAKEDHFYYHLTYDPYQKSLVADKGEIRVGTKYQAEVPSIKMGSGGGGSGGGANGADEASSGGEQSATPSNDRVLRSQKSQQSQPIEVPIAQHVEEILQWLPVGSAKNTLTDADIDKYLIVAKSIGTFARALDCNNAYKQPSLPLSAAAASREITLFHAMNTLHENNYDIGRAVLSLITASGPVLCRDELEEWSAAEANLFEDALEKYGKEFTEIRKDYLPWKSMKSIIEYYYSWKTTDRYLQQKRIKLNEQESKLKQVYIPTHSKQNQSAMIKTSHVQVFQQYDVHLRNSCESCGAPNTSTSQWYAYSPSTLVQLVMGNQANNPTALAQAHTQAIQAAAAANPAAPSTVIYQARMCAECWTYWKRYASFKFQNARQERQNQLKNQVHKCAVAGCGREFKMKQLLAKHCAIAHGYFTKAMPGQQQQQQSGARHMPVRNRTAFHLLTTPMTRAARYALPNIIRVRKLARRPFKLVDLGELNREWFKETRSITDLLATRASKRRDRLGKCKLDVKLIQLICKARAAKKAKVTNGTTANGHVDEVDMADEDDDQLVIDYEKDEDKPEFLKYFETKCTTPCYTPDRIAFPKPTPDVINKFHMNLMSQNRKRPLDGASGEGGIVGAQQGGARGQNGGSDTENVPLIKRTLLGNAHKSQPSTQLKQQQITTNQRMSQKSNRPTAAVNLPNSPEEWYLLGVASIKTLRRETENVSIRRLARKPFKLLTGETATKLYAIFEKRTKEAMAKHQIKSNTSVNKLTNGSETGSGSGGGDNEDAVTVAADDKKASELNGAATKTTSGSVVVLD